MSSRQNITRPSANNSRRDDDVRLPSIQELFGPELSQRPRPASLTTHSPSIPSMQLNERGDRTGDPSHAANTYPMYGRGRMQEPPYPGSSHYPGAAYPSGPPTYAPPHPRPNSTDPGWSHSHSRAPDARHAISPPPHPAEHGRYYPNTAYSNDPSHSRHPRDTQGAQRAPPPSAYQTQRMATPAPQPSYSAASYPRGVPSTIALDAGPSNYDPISAHSSRYECEYCGKGFTRPSSLKIHIHSHTGERPYKCTFEGCERTFSVLSNMRRHARTHQHPNAADVQETSEDDQDEGEDSPTATHGSGSGSGRGGVGSARGSSSGGRSN
ncbi:hypothetical protein PENSPDRAFT_198784 [Peniophora sp. CONT]|nr:hypothetical protein PENSPDRAFT_198784 [Peniophora sp. CONT]